MFNDRVKLTAAVLEGRKTMTRRAIPQRVIEEYDEWSTCVSGIGCSIQTLQEAMLLKARYKIGEVVAVAQRYCDVLHCADVPKGEEKGWGNKMFVKAELMPHHIEITGIKIERLQDISDEDCLKEGIDRCECYEAILLNKGGVKYAFGDCSHCYNTAREAFAALIDKVSGKGTWDSNPWVFVYDFKLID